MKVNVLSQVLSAGLISLTLLAGCQSASESQTTAEPAQTGLSQEANVPSAPVQAGETSANIDPADRKFFMPGYGVNAGGYEASEALMNVDPADRKFFTPGYGANAGGYGANTSGDDLTVYRQSEWGRTPGTNLSIEEQALAIYHQSEWDRTPNTGLSVEELRKIDPADRKFFTPGYGAYAAPNR
ncbi:MAG: hypothetical protein HYR94_03530 [Chloroflexi bacterium]|nr:hypothetical protein [Chloroflexota bacterium]